MFNKMVIFYTIEIKYALRRIHTTIHVTQIIPYTCVFVITYELIKTCLGE